MMDRHRTLSVCRVGGGHPLVGALAIAFALGLGGVGCDRDGHVDRPLATPTSSATVTPTASATPTATPTLPADEAPFDRFLNIAHRGGLRLAPEHTLVAYENALAVGADVIEFDLLATADGEIVILHDTTVDRTTNGSGVVRNMTYAEIAELDAGFRFTRDGGATYPWRGQGLRIPRLQEALEILDGVLLAVEFKQVGPADVDTAMAIFADYGAIERTIFASFDSRLIARVREVAPHAVTAMDTREFIQFSAVDLANPRDYVPPALIVQPPASTVSAELMEKVVHFGLKIHPWTVNSAVEMRRLLDLGVDGIFTDDPVLLGEVLAERD